jgi:hypothetical protein
MRKIMVLLGALSAGMAQASEMTITVLRSVAPFGYGGIFMPRADGFYRVCLKGLFYAFGLFLHVLGTYFKAFALMKRPKIKGNNSAQ